MPDPRQAVNDVNRISTLTQRQFMTSCNSFGVQALACLHVVDSPNGKNKLKLELQAASCIGPVFKVQEMDWPRPRKPLWGRRIQRILLRQKSAMEDRKTQGNREKLLGPPGGTPGSTAGRMPPATRHAADYTTMMLEFKLPLRYRAQSRCNRGSCLRVFV